MPREKFSSRLGFLLISAGCAIGLGNVWRFPYITGEYGGGAFVLLYLLFLIIMGIPIMTMELAVGRASKKSAILSFEVLQPKGTKWSIFGYIAIMGNYMLMMFYTSISGWMFMYFLKMLMGEFEGLSPKEVEGVFGNMVNDPMSMGLWMVIVVLVGFFICSLGLVNGVEKITKMMMGILLLLLMILVIKSISLPNSMEGLHFYLKPDFNKIFEAGIDKVIFIAMGQAFFTLSIGMGCIAIFGTYIGDDRSLAGESINITLLDTFVAIMAGLIIFPATSAFGVPVNSGPSLVFITLPNIFNSMTFGRLWGSLFFLFMSFAAMSTVITVFENIMASFIDRFEWDRKKTGIVNSILVILLSIPCVLGFNVLSHIQPLGEGSMILDFEDFIVSNNILPLGSLVYLLFCTLKYGWGWDNFVEESNKGKGIKFPKWIKFYICYILPIILLYIFAKGYMEIFFKK